jgi:6-phosphofructokinase 1
LSSLLVFQSGGPTAVLNASLTGIVREGRTRYDYVLGARRGLEGLIAGDIIDLTALPDERLERLRGTPSAALGTSRLRPDDDQLDGVLDALRRWDATGIVAIGGNDTAETSQRLAGRALSRGMGLGVIGLPKTIDNDLAVTDHSLGFPSAARCLALITRAVTFDAMATATLYPVKIIEVPGRNAGWLAASCSLAIPAQMPAPITCLPERPLPGPEAFLQHVRGRIERDGFAVVVAPETKRWADGAHVAGAEPEWIDPFGHPYFASAGQALVRLCSQALGVRARMDRPGTFTRSAMELASSVDLEEAERCGRFAVEALSNGVSGQCVVIERLTESPYSSRPALTPLKGIANVERRMPDEMIDANGLSVSSRFCDYALPLLGEPLSGYETLY